MDSPLIGVFDSGVGGLTVVAEILRVLPRARIRYLGDTAHLPYGSKTKAKILDLSFYNAEYLLGLGIDVLVIACNTASALAFEELKAWSPVPVLGVIEPALEGVRDHEDIRCLGLIATSSTIRSAAYERGLDGWLQPGHRFIKQACPLLVPLVEEGWRGTDVTRLVLESYLEPLRQAGVDHLILGCTHFPVLQDQIASILGPSCHLINPAERTAATLARLVDGLARPLRSAGTSDGHRFAVTDNPDRFGEIGHTIFGWPLGEVEVVHPGQWGPQKARFLAFG